jgi:hypothetical protein
MKLWRIGMGVAVASLCTLGSTASRAQGEGGNADDVGLEAMCKRDPIYCEKIDMEYYANREVHAEIYAFQTYDNFGCGTCTLGKHSPTPLPAVWLLAALACALRRRANS